jgi:hypothetical protein
MSELKRNTPSEEAIKAEQWNGTALLILLVITLVFQFVIFK